MFCCVGLGVGARTHYPAADLRPCNLRFSSPPIGHRNGRREVSNVVNILLNKPAATHLVHKYLK
jgi:hypothetical protein